MKYSDLEFGKKSTLSFDLKGKAAARLRPGEPLKLRAGATSGEWIVCYEGSDFEAYPADPRSASLLRQIFERGCHRLARVLATRPNRLIIAVHEFPGELTLPESISIGVDEKVIDLARHKRKQYTSVEEVVNWLNEEIVLSEGENGDHYVFLTGTPGKRRDLSGAFRLLGQTVSVDVKTDADGRLNVERVVYAKRNTAANEAQTVHLVRGHLRFGDATTAHEFRGLAKDLIDQIIKEGESYLDLWNRYNEIERQIHLRRARDFGFFPYNSCRQLPHGDFEFTLSDEIDEETLRTLADAGDQFLEAAQTLPVDFSESSETGRQPQARAPKRSFTGTLVTVRGGKVVLQTVEEDPVHPEPSGIIFLSIRGDEARLKRRENAQRRIVAGSNPMPQLGLILEGRHAPERRIKHEKPISQAAKAAFRGEPTDRQRSALDLALNSPDIALIQGPPGTGKTRVIAALQTRLAEIHGDHAHVSGRILLTSYQHDAVENVAEATEVFGLPAIKIGRKRDFAVQTDGFVRWLMDRKEAVDKQLSVTPKKSISPIIDKVNQLESSHRQSFRALADLTRSLADLESLVSNYISGPTHDQIDLLKRTFGANGSSKAALSLPAEKALRSVRGLRVDSISFSDDGPDQAYKALHYLSELGGLSQEDEDLLKRLQDMKPRAAPEGETLDALKRLQEQWVDRLSVPPDRDTRKAGPNAAFLSLCNAVRMDLREKRALDPGEGIDAALHEYRQDLEDEDLMRKTIESYSSSLAATCQQAVGRDMIDLKGDPDAWPTFEIVIVDEAARANPLDLLIPLSLAERKIILVGDHRQLPHLLEPEIESELEAETGGSMREKLDGALRESLFERLFKMMRDRESRDGIARTVTLDCQYRMHPLLGDFISDTFYRPHGEGFRSGRSADEMAHEVEGYLGTPAAWVDVPNSRGTELNGMSKARPVEARWIAAEAKRIADAYPHYSVGVITFYRDQVDLILDELEKEGLAERAEDGRKVISTAYRQTRDVQSGRLKERMRVGTVDAFQGKEFDVVILSMVRSNQFSATRGLKEMRRKYGYLMLENRLCVGMSRQQRLLIVCGDSRMLHGNGAEEAIPGLIAFHRLCSEKGRVIRA